MPQRYSFQKNEKDSTKSKKEIVWTDDLGVIS